MSNRKIIRIECPPIGSQGREWIASNLPILRTMTPDVELHYWPAPNRDAVGVQVFAMFDKYNKKNRRKARRFARLLMLATGKVVRMHEGDTQVDLSQ